MSASFLSSFKKRHYITLNPDLIWMIPEIKTGKAKWAADS